MVMLAGEMNGHVGSNGVGNDGLHGGYGFGDTKLQMAPGFWSLQMG